MNQKQCKMARIGLGWTRSFLAEKSGVAPKDIVDFENGARWHEACAKELKRTLTASNRVTFQGNCSVFITND
ncbi:MAG: helix-turn-helix transcriptional regulator [Pseudomonadota bacterium]